MESTLALSYTDLQKTVGFEIGYGRGELAGERTWTARQAADIEDCIRSGLRRFYQEFDWSFLRPVAEFTLAEGARAITMPDDFAGLDEKLECITSGTAYWFKVQIGHTGDIDRGFSLTPDLTGPPRVAAIRALAQGARSLTLTKGQRYELMVYPAADQEYTLRGRYVLLPDAITSVRPFPYGGAQHAQTLEAACLMAVEERIDNTAGVWAAKYAEKLARSLDRERSMNPVNYGYNRDRSDDREWLGHREQRFNPVTFFGVVPGT